MTSAILTAAPAQPQVAARFLGFFRAEPLFAATGLFMLLLIPPTLAAMAIDPRLHLGENIWIKPLKFEISLAVYFLTLAFYARWLPAGLTQKIWYRLFAASVVIATLAEMIWIGGAAAMGTSSHFNVSSPFMARLYPIMGLLATLITSATAVYAFHIWRNKNSGLTLGSQLAMTTGLFLTLPLTLIVAFTLAGNGGHFVGGSGSESLPLLGWSRDGGDLRVAHFFALHAMHFVPAAGLVLEKLVAERKAMVLVLAFAALYAGLVAHTFVEATRGQAFLAFVA